MQKVLGGGREGVFALIVITLKSRCDESKDREKARNVNRVGMINKSKTQREGERQREKEKKT